MSWRLCVKKYKAYTGSAYVCVAGEKQLLRLMKIYISLNKLFSFWKGRLTTNCFSDKLQR